MVTGDVQVPTRERMWRADGTLLYDRTYVVPEVRERARWDRFSPGDYILLVEHGDQFWWRAFTEAEPW